MLAQETEVDRVDAADREGGDPAQDLDVLGGSGPVDFEDFAQHHLRPLLAYAVALTGDRDLAADLVQDVLARAYDRWSRIGATGRPDLYVKRMVTNEHLSWRRRWHVRKIVPVDDEVLHARAPRHGDHSQQVVDRDDVRQRLSRLPRRQRTVLVLRYYEGLDDAGIAEVLGVAVSTVRSNAARALATLRVSAPTTEEAR